MKWASYSGGHRKPTPRRATRRVPYTSRSCSFLRSLGQRPFRMLFIGRPIFEPLEYRVGNYAGLEPDSSRIAIRCRELNWRSFREEIRMGNGVIAIYRQCFVTCQRGLDIYQLYPGAACRINVLIMNSCLEFPCSHSASANGCAAARLLF